MKKKAYVAPLSRVRAVNLDAVMAAASLAVDPNKSTTGGNGGWAKEDDEPDNTPKNFNVWE